MKLRQSGAAMRLRYICDSEGGLVTNYSEKIVLMNNGIEYYFVEVMSSSGTKYRIYAHGSEAIELYQETENMLKVQHLVDIIIDICT